MVHAVYKCNNDIYTIIIISDTSYIDEDISSVSAMITDTDLAIYKENMVQSVSQKLAFSVFKNDIRIGFMYNRLDVHVYKGASVRLTDPIGVLLGMKTVFELLDTHKITFIPHAGGIKNFLSLVYGPDIREYYSGAKDLVVRRVYIEPKGLQMYKYLGIEKIQ